MSHPHDQPLAEVSLFQGVSAEEIYKVRTSGTLIKRPPGGFFFMQGDPASAIFVLAEGRVRLGQITPEGQQVLLRLITPWTPFGAVALADDETYPVTAEAAEASLAYSWSKEKMMTLVTEIPILAMNALKLMAGHVQEFQERYRELATLRVERRLAGTLLRLAAQTGMKTEQGVLINLPLTRQELAEMTGTTLFTVSRILSQWEAKGLVISGREKVIISNPHGLVKIAEDLP